MLRREAAGRAAVPERQQRLGDGWLRLEIAGFPLDEAAAALAWIKPTAGI